MNNKLLKMVESLINESNIKMNEAESREDYNDWFYFWGQLEAYENFKNIIK